MYTHQFRIGRQVLSRIAPVFAILKVQEVGTNRFLLHPF